MLNGNNMFPPPYNFGNSGVGLPQETLGLPVPSTADEYFLLSQSHIYANDTDYAGFKCYYNRIKMTNNNGQGQVTEKHVQIFTDTMEAYSFSAVKHANGRDWWLLMPDRNNGNFYEMLATRNGVRLYDTVFTERTPRQDCYSTFSPNGSKFCFISSWKTDDAPYKAQLFIWDFDRCTGMLSNMQDTTFVYPPNGGYQSVAISPNSKYLYAACYNKVVQFDLDKPDIIGSATLIDTYDGFLAGTAGYDYDSTYFAYSQLGPDGRIYISTPATRYMHRIDYPNKAGKACGLKQHLIHFPVFSYGSMPNNPHYRLGPVDGSACDTLGLDNHPLAGFRWENLDVSDYRKIEFTDNSFYEPATWEWDFAGLGVSNDTNPVFTFPADGVYKVCLKVCNQYSCDSICKLVTIGTLSNTEASHDAIFLKVYPNPAHNQIFLETSESSDGFSITNLFGQVIFKGKFDNRRAIIDSTAILSGVYFIYINNQAVAKKIVISHY